MLSLIRKSPEVVQKKRIDEWALDYWLLQRYAKFCYRFYYRSISVVNRENLPENQPVILAPNHQNALMDALALVCNTELQTVFLARADIFKGKLLVRLLTAMNIMPVYRIRDGYENLKKNDEVFVKTTEVLQNKLNPLCLFPEGNHGDKRRLRGLVKGLFRIAFIAQEGYGQEPGIKIIPVGIDYSHYTHFRADVFVNIGKPIEVAEYWTAYQENPVQGINLLKERYAAEVSRLMIDIRTEEFYDSYMALRTIFNEDMRRSLGIAGRAPVDRFRADKEMIRRLDRTLEDQPHKVKELDAKVRNYQDLLARFRLRDWVVRKPGYSTVSLLMAGLLKIVLLPVFLVGAFNNYLPYWFTAGRVRKIKDPQFHSSFKFVIGLLAFPVWYIPIIAFVWIHPHPLWFRVAYTLLLPATGLWAFRYAMSLKKLLARMRYAAAVRKRNPEVLRMQELRREIVGTMQEIAETYKENHEDKG
jgi:1-acyl-sn-glycerol-3-phosphate acyltransferase